MLWLLACSGSIDAYVAGVPHVVQKPDFCGEACVEMAMRHLGYTVDQDAVFDLTGVDPALGRGARAAELAVALRALGFDPGPVWAEVPRGQLDGELARLVESIRAGVPVVVCMRAGAEEGAPEHFRLVIGWDEDAGELVYHDPARVDGAALRMSRAEFLDAWPLRYAPDVDTVIQMPLKPGWIRVPERAPGPTAADVAQRVRLLRDFAPEGFSLVVERPFVVLGDGGDERVAGYASGTVRWATRRLREAYGWRDPDRVFGVWLFEGDESYRRNAWQLFGEVPDTPYGYTSGDHAALVMNIQTGGGTLVHEMVHAFLHTNVPGPAPWFNEGLASLYEASGERDGAIVGLPNWRLPGLQDRISRGQLGSFEQLLRRDVRGFYGDESGANYAQARYLLLWLQEEGLLRRYYDAYVDRRAADPAGVDALRAVVGDDLSAFQRRWEEWVMAFG
ncbi:MAG: C39 family peptidase [Myxococcota bacterium]